MATLLFFGAGASRPFGIPTMQEMVTQFEEELKQKGSTELSLYSKIKKIQESDYIFKADIESIFSVIQGIASNTKPRGMGHLPYYYIASNGINNEFSRTEIDQAKKLQSLLEDFVKRKCEPQKDSTEMNKIYSRSYHALFSFLPGNKQAFEGGKVSYPVDWRAYTTNYDLIFEQFWGDYMTPSDYFVQDGASKNQVFRDDSPQLNLPSFLKLHGSLDWLQEQSGKIMKIHQSFTRHKLEGEVMIFPIQQKDMYLHPWITLFQDLKKSLKQADRWIVIGYAFNDEFIFEIFKEALFAENKLLVIISPHAKELRGKFPENLRSKIVPLPIKFGDDFFPTQFKEYFEEMRTLELKIRTKSQAFGFQSSTPIRFVEVIGDNGPSRTGILDGVNSVTLSGNVPHKDDLVKCTIKFSHKPPYDKDLIFQYITENSYDITIEVYFQNRLLSRIQGKTTRTDLEKPYLSDPITIPAQQLFIKT